MSAFDTSTPVASTLFCTWVSRVSVSNLNSLFRILTEAASIRDLCYLRTYGRIAGVSVITCSVGVVCLIAIYSVVKSIEGADLTLRKTES